MALEGGLCDSARSGRVPGIIVDIVRWFPDGRAGVLHPGSSLAQRSGRCKAGEAAESGPPQNQGKSWIFSKNLLFPNFVRGLFWTFVRSRDRLLEVFTVRYLPLACVCVLQ